jgi:hypothetical protein
VFAGGEEAFNMRKPSHPAPRRRLVACGGLSLAVGALALGCGGKLLETAEGDAGTVQGGPEADASPGSSSSSGGTDACDLNGSSALKVSIDVSWAAGEALTAGSGTMDLWALLRAAPSGESLSITLLPCGVTLPDFGSILAETYGLVLPDAIFDHSPPDIPATTTTVNLTSASAGMGLMLPIETTLIGLTMPDPATDPWPSSASAVAQVDMDRDGKPGVTATAKTGGPYRGLPVAVSLAPARADALYMVLRSSVGVTASIGSCSEASGSASVSRLDSHVVGCHVQGGGDCTASQANLVDANRPVYSVGSATFRAVRVDGAATCKDVRAALPP